ncbi:ankyrin repeat and SAM domain-containing protein 3-like isoform X2 [Tubulanus polymorphus]|uniref:ankyrin repeat and SAM domain-containing protein 3-like isoform X2 n=1 Tax=Tubulanus polymorphus TaxID=672921 RepID=UPI003DA23073
MASSFEFDDSSGYSSESEMFDSSLSMWTGLSAEESYAAQLDVYTAASIGQYDCVYNALQNDEMSVHRRNSGGWTPLMYASYIGHENIVTLLLRANVDVNIRNNKGQTALILAASCGNDTVCYFLLKADAELEAKDNSGWTALFHATSAGHQNMVTFLIENKADMNSREPNKGMTPFMEAASEGHEIIVQYFLQNGVDVNLKNNSDSNARTLALMKGYTKVASLIDYHVASQKRLKPGDVSSSDFNQNVANNRPVKISLKGPSILDGPHAFAKLIQKQKSNSETVEEALKSGQSPNLRELTSPIHSDDHKQDTSSSSGSSRGSLDVDVEEEDDAFSRTGALTIKSGSADSKNLADALKRTTANSSQLIDSTVQTVANIANNSYPVHSLQQNTYQMKDLKTLLQQLGLTKYLTVFEEQDVDLQVFLSLTDNDLKEIGIKLFGPRRKMTNAIARWHSNACPACNSLEHSYADKLEAEMQEMAIQLQRGYEQNEKLKAQVLQERELRSVAEGCLMETRASWQIVQRIATETRHHCSDMTAALQQISIYQKEIWKRHRQGEQTSRPNRAETDRIYSSSSNAEQTDVNNLEGLTLEQLHSSLSYYYDEFKRAVTLSTVNMDKLLGQDSSNQYQS